MKSYPPEVIKLMSYLPMELTGRLLNGRQLHHRQVVKLLYVIQKCLVRLRDASILLMLLPADVH